MQHLGKVLGQTSWKGVSDTLNNNSDTLYEAITQLENVTIKNAGYFLSEDALKKAVPNPTMGMIAYVRDLNSGVYYIWNTYLKDNVPTWTGTTTTVPEPNISMDAIEGLEASVQGVSDKQDELTNRIDTNGNNIEALQKAINTHNTKFSSVDDDITALQQDKQDKLAHYTEEDENATIATRETISLHTAQQVGAASMSIDATTSEVEISSTNHNSEHARVLLNNGNISIDADVKVSMSCDRGETVIEDVVGTIKEIVDYMAKDETDDDQITVTLNQHEARLGELTDSVQMLRDETEDLQSMRDTIDRLDTDKADKSALEAINKTVEGKQDTLQTYEEATDKAEVKMPNGNSYIRVTKGGAGMYAQDGKSGIVNSSSGSRLVYMETATDASGSSYTSHRDDISIGKHDGDNNATHITMTSKSTTEEAGEKITNTSTIQVNPTGICMSSPEGEIEDIIKAIKGKADKGEIVDIINDLTTGGTDKALSAEMGKELGAELATKAPKSGYAPDLKVNFAKELVGRGEATPEVIGGIRPTGVRSIGDGNATIERIKGKSVVWNQHIRGVTDNLGYTAGLSMSISEDGVITLNGTTTAAVMNPFITSYGKHSNALINAPLGRYVLDVKVINNPDNLNLNIHALNNRIYFSPNNTPTTSYQRIGDCTSLNNGGSFGMAAYGGKGVVFNNVQLKVSLYHLTQMFGAGKEPTTIEEFETRKPLNVSNEYNEGTIVSYNGDALKSVGFNAYNGTYAKVIGGEEYHATGTTSISFAKELDGDATPITLDDKGKFKPEEDGYVFAEGKDIVIHLTHSYTPEHVDEYEEDVHPLPDVKSILDADGNQLFPYGLLSAGSAHDEITATKAIKRIGKRAYAEGDEANASVLTDGTSTLYALATPIEVDLPEPLNMTYEAWDFGTEELIADSATTPLNADIVYQFNAVDRIRENSSAIDVLEGHVEERKDDGIELLTNGNLKLTLKGETREFMPATPSGDPMHWAYVSAGAEYNATNDYILKYAPWKDMVDTIEDKAKWGLDVVDASKVKQMTIKGVEYNYATENRTSPEGGTYLRYFIVGKGSNGTWVEDETKVLHLPGHWYLNGLGDITDAEMRSIYAVKHMSYDLFGGFAGTPCRTFIDKVKHTGSDLTYGDRYHRCKKVESIYSSVQRVVNAGFNYAITSTTALRYFLPAVTLVSYTGKIYGTFGDASLRVLSIAGVQTAIQFPSKYISKASILYAINNVAPTLASAITITLHHDAYERLKGDADILQALTTKNADLANTGDGKGKVSLVCATDNDTIPSE